MTLQTYSLFGLSLASDFPFKTCLAPFETSLATGMSASGVAAADEVADEKSRIDLEFRRIPEAPFDLPPEIMDDSKSCRTPDGEGAGYLYRLETVDFLRFIGCADYYLGFDRIDCHIRDADRLNLVEIQLLGSGLSYWLERRGFPTLHSSAVEIEGAAVAFLSQNNGGKTGLAAALIRQGQRLITDDVLPLEATEQEILARPGYPQMRMWPDEAAHYLDRWQDLETVHPAHSKRRVPVSARNFCNSKTPLKCLYLPLRRPANEGATRVEITPLKPRDALIELVRHSFAPYIVEAMGWQEWRLSFFARLVKRLPVRRLIYPSGFDHLPRVSEEILEDLRGL